MADASFIDVATGTTYTTMNDEHELVRITEKNVTVGDIGKIVQGETNSQEIEFSIPRFYDNVDLLDKDFYILYQTKGGIFKSEAIDKAYNDEEIRFNWLIDENATMYSSPITACVQIQGTDELGKAYVLKSGLFKINVEESLGEYGADGVYRTWATDIETRITDLESITSFSQATFIGTTAEYNDANVAGNIQSGMFVTITDA